MLINRFTQLNAFSFMLFIIRVGFLLPLLLVLSLSTLGINSYAQNATKNSIQGDRSISQSQQDDCNPEISLSVSNQSRFNILKDLANDHGFTLEVLESDNKPISIEKNQRLFKVIESITRDMNVVLQYRTQNGCEKLVAISLLNEGEWKGKNKSKTRLYSPSNSPSKQIRPRLLRDENRDNSKEAQERRKNATLIQQQRLEKKKQRGEVHLNESLENGASFKNNFTAKKGFQKNVQSLENNDTIDDMESYVQEVLDGDRVPDLRSMTSSERSKYMRIRRKLRRAQ